MIGSFVIILISFLISLMHGINIKAIEKNLITYFLGITFYFSLIIRYRASKKNYKKILIFYF